MQTTISKLIKTEERSQKLVENTVGQGEIDEINTVGKGEIARNKQFLPFPQCFQKTCTADT